MRRLPSLGLEAAGRALGDHRCIPRQSLEIEVGRGQEQPHAAAVAAHRVAARPHISSGPEQDAGDLTATVADRSARIAPACLHVDLEDLMREISPRGMVFDTSARYGAISPVGSIAGDRKRFARSRRFRGQRQWLHLRALDGQGGQVPVVVSLQHQGPAAEPIRKTTVIGPVASRTTCQLVTTRPWASSTATRAPVPSDAPSCSAAMTRTTAGWGVCAAGATAAGQATASAGQITNRTAWILFTRLESLSGSGATSRHPCSSAISKHRVQQSGGGRKSR